MSSPTPTHCACESCFAIFMNPFLQKALTCTFLFLTPLSSVLVSLLPERGKEGGKSLCLPRFLLRRGGPQPDWWWCPFPEKMGDKFLLFRDSKISFSCPRSFQKDPTWKMWRSIIALAITGKLDLYKKCLGYIAPLTNRQRKHFFLEKLHCSSTWRGLFLESHEKNIQALLCSDAKGRKVTWKREKSYGHRRLPNKSWTKDKAGHGTHFWKAQ